MTLCRVLSTLIFILFVDYSVSEFNLTIVHISDFHSHWFEFNENEGICTKSQSEDGKCFGGFPRLLTFVRDIRSKEKNVVVLSSGEFFLGRSLYALHGWKIANALLPRLKLDAMSLANHDFSSGVFELSAFLYGMKFPVLCANMWARETSFLHSRVNKSAVLDVNGEKVGIIGYLHPEALEKSRKAVSVKFYPEMPYIEKEVRHLETQGIDKIIALGHSGYYTDMEIAQTVKGVDVVIGGDSDIVLEEPDDENYLESLIGNIHGNYPRIHHHQAVNDTERNKTLVLHVPQHGKYVGVVRVTFDDYGKIIHESGEPVLLDSSIPQDEETLNYLRKATLALEEYARNSRLPDEEEVLAEAEGYFESRKCRMEECPLGNLVTDAMLQTYIDHEHEKQTELTTEQWGLVDAVVFNSGSIRYTLSAGDITINDLLYSIYAGDFMVRVKMSGKQLQEMLEHSVEKYDPMGVTASGSFLQMSGLRVVYDLDKAPGNRVSKVYIRCRGCLMDTTKPVDPHKMYFVAMPGFMSRGGDGYREYKAVNSEDFGQPEILLIVHYLRTVESVKPILNGRISFVNKPAIRKYATPQKADDFNTTSSSTPVSATSTFNTTETLNRNKPSDHDQYLEKNYTYISLMLGGNMKNLYKMDQIKNSSHEANVTSETKERAFPVTTSGNNSSLKTTSHPEIRNSNELLRDEQHQKHFLTTNVSFGFNAEATTIELNGTTTTLLRDTNTSTVQATSTSRLTTAENNSSLKTTSLSGIGNNNDSITEEIHKKIFFTTKKSYLEPKAEVTSVQSNSITPREKNFHDGVNTTSNANISPFTTNTKGNLITENSFSIDESKQKHFQEINIAENLINPRLTTGYRKSAATHNSISNAEQTLSTEKKDNYSSDILASSFKKTNPILNEFENIIIDTILQDFNVSAFMTKESGYSSLGQDLKQRLKSFFKNRMEVTTLNPVDGMATEIFNRIKEHYMKDLLSFELHNSSSQEGNNQTEHGHSLLGKRHNATDLSIENTTTPSLFNLNETHQASLETNTEDRKKIEENSTSAVKSEVNTIKSEKHSSEDTDLHLTVVEDITDLLVDVVFNSITEKMKTEFDSKTSTFGSGGLPNNVTEGNGVNKTRSAEKQTIKTPSPDKEKKTTSSPKDTAPKTMENNFIDVEKGKHHSNFLPVVTPVVKDANERNVLNETLIPVFNSTEGEVEKVEQEVEWFPWLRF